MKFSNCLDSKQLIDYSDGKLTQNDNQSITNHLVKCERCTRNLKILNRLDEILNMEDKKVKDDIYSLKKSSNCISDELLYRYLDTTVTESEAAAIETHLYCCSACFNDMAAIVKNLLSPITDFERNEINKLRTITPDEQVTRILERFGPMVEKSLRDKKVKITATIKERVKEFFEKWLYTRYIWRPAIVFSVIFIIMAGIFAGVRYYNIGYQIYQAEKLLLNKHRIYIENPRLSGGYGATGIGMLMGREDDELSYVEKTKSKLNKAIEKGSKSIKAKQLLAQTFIIEKQNADADSIFKTIGAKINTSASLLNDRGVLYFQEGDWVQAEYNFQAALEIDKDFLEAYYNLAIAKRKLGELNEAMLMFKQYIEHEPVENWRNAAQHMISEIIEERQQLK